MTMYADMGSGGEPQPHASRYAVDTATQVAIGSVADAVAIPVQEPPLYRVSVICICADAAERKARSKEATIERAIGWERKRAQGLQRVQVDLSDRGATVWSLAL